MRKINIRPPVSNIEQHGGRLLIARQQRPPAPYDGAKAKRIAKACTNCRKRKTKCTGESPHCVECQTNNLPCVYEHGRRDRIRDLTSHKDLLIALVRDLAANVGDAEKTRIKDVLQEINEDSDLLLRSEATHAHLDMDTGDPFLDARGEFSGSTSTAYTTSEREPDPGHSFSNEENLFRPEIALLRESDKNPSSAQPCVTDIASTSSAADTSLWLGDVDVEVDDLVHGYDTPSFNEASELFHLYLNTVHGWLPILPIYFDDQMRRYYKHPFQVTSRWKAMLNLVFAIAARYRHLTHGNEGLSGSRGDEDVIYMSRAMQLLAVDSTAILTSNPDLPLIQTLGLLSLYYLSVGHVDRAWSTVSIALRLGIVLNLHLKSDSPEVWHSRIDAESLTWWSLRSLDTFLSSITGRPSAISDQDCNMTLPRNLSTSHGQQQSTAFLQTNLKIVVVAQWALSSLYSISAIKLPHRIIQERINTLVMELEALLPAVTDHQRLVLQFNWFYTMILITRPCLRLIATHSEDDPEAPAEVFERARQCVRAAQSLVRLFPEEPGENLFHNGPWWCMTHHIMQAMDVLILALSDQPSDPSILLSVKSLIRWLQWMQPKDKIAQRALASILENRTRVGDDNFTDVFQQDAGDIYTGHSLPRWDLGMGTGAEPSRFMDHLGAMETLVESTEPGDVFPQPQSGFLPMPPGSSSAYAAPQDLWDW